MPACRSLFRVALPLLFCLMAACSSQKEPAHKLILDTDAVITAAAGEASKYVPEELADVQGRLETLKSAYDNQDYATVVGSGPAVLGAAQSLATAAAAKKDAMLQALNNDWSELAAQVPAGVAAVQGRLEELGRKSPRKVAAGVDINGSKIALGVAMSLWSKAQAAFAAGNLDEAVSTARDVQAKVAEAAALLRLELPKPAAT